MNYSRTTFGNNGSNRSKTTFGFDAHALGNRSIRSGAAMGLFLLQVAVNQLTTRHCVYRTLSHLPT
jgi:hypothetical protein